MSWCPGMSTPAWVAFAAVSTLWGIPYLFIKVAVDDGVSPAFLAWVRVVLGAVVCSGSRRAPVSCGRCAVAGAGSRSSPSWRSRSRLRSSRPASSTCPRRWRRSSSPRHRCSSRCWRCASTTRSASGGTRLAGLLLGLAGVVALATSLGLRRGRRARVAAHVHRPASRGSCAGASGGVNAVEAPSRRPRRGTAEISGVTRTCRAAATVAAVTGDSSPLNSSNLGDAGTHLRDGNPSERRPLRLLSRRHLRRRTPFSKDAHRLSSISRAVYPRLTCTDLVPLACRRRRRPRGPTPSQGKSCLRGNDVRKFRRPRASSGSA